LSAREVALTLRVWAQENNILKTDFPVEFHMEHVEERDQAFDALRISAFSESIFRKRGITGIAFNEAANLVTVFTDKAVPAKELKDLPKLVHEDVHIQYKHSGIAHAAPPGPTGTPSPYVLRGDKYSCGGSIHPAKITGAGTLGCLVKNEQGVIFGLSNNHVSGMCNYASSGEKILAPGHLDITSTGIDPFTIGYHHGSLPMAHGTPDNVNIETNNDAALLLIADASRLSSMQGDQYDTPELTVAMTPNLDVEKVGRTTGHTKGRIIGQFIGPHPVSYNIPGFGSHIAYFEPVFAIEGTPGQPFSQPGDSGSLIVTTLTDQRYAVGLVFAGNTNGLTFALPLAPILEAFNVSLVSAHNI
jgi:hypothetical protein